MGRGAKRRRPGSLDNLVLGLNEPWAGSWGGGGVWQDQGSPHLPEGASRISCSVILSASRPPPPRVTPRQTWTSLAGPAEGALPPGLQQGHAHVGTQLFQI